THRLAHLQRPEGPGAGWSLLSGAAIAAAAAPGSGAPVIGRPMTKRSAPARSASSGVATRAHPRGDEHDVGAHFRAHRRDLAGGADQSPGAGADREHGQSAHYIL